MSASLFARLAERFPAERGRVAIETAEGAAVTFADLLEHAGRITALFKASGVAPGDRIAVQVEKSVANVALYLAVLQCGAVHVPLNPAYTPAELGHFLKDARPKVLVCDPGSEAALAALAKQGSAWLFTLGADGHGSLTAQAEGLPSDRAVAARSGEDIAAILYTSGTTGLSKGAMLSHDNLWSNAATLHALWGFRPGDVLIHALPLYHTHGLFVALNLMLMNGGRILLLPRFDADQVIGLMARATVLMGVPTFYTRLLASEGLTREAAGGMRLFVSGSAPLLARTHADFEARTGQRILERYGMTETGMSASNPLHGERRAGTVGLALPGVALRVCDGEGRALPPGEVGVLEVRGPNVFLGYWNLPEKTAAEFRADGYFITGDLATIAADGYVSIVGRAKDLIISGGLNVYPKEVETALDALPGIVESAVIGVPHPDLGEAVVAVVTATGEPGDLAGALRDRLAGFKIPKRVLRVEALPRNAMGKVQKNLLRERFAGLFAG
ncbi:MAG TPA: malonyl-CoA synthase [Amaricoccus sp.]|uniref:malonate--CoA ligase n=2 Tax=Amaricoccus sp. TaxID=1872485 RepID=UPI002B58BB90|nr:malonyl-CoA synthase [Amaricoccus sp.]HMR53186.1 malonyl-CoA synthase [Amaricoccus sp.]HMU00082.1 malonyl-CoA synthase [Amaricoccus sp.]